MNKLQDIVNSCCTRKEFREKYSSEFSKINIVELNELFKNHINKGYIKTPDNYWTYELLQEEANKYKTKREFKENNISAYRIALSKKILGELFKNHINQGLSENKKPNHYWTLELLQIEANKYENRIDFKKYNYPAYISSCVKKLIDELFKNHTNNGYLDKPEWKENNYIIYVYELPEYKKAYVGLTKNITQRNKDHIDSNNDSLNTFCNENNIYYPEYKILEDNLKSDEARNREIYWVNYYKNDNWCMFNIMKPGSLGGSTLIWNNKKLQEEANKYETRGDFFKNSSTAYIIASGKKLMDKLFKNHINQGFTNKKERDGFWTIDKLQIIVDKYDTINDFRKNDHSYWIIAHNRKMIKELFKNHINNGYIRTHNINKK